ncbi:MAG: histidine kinase dimerization/phospho-acceptor domain-containing protein, partial [Planctomycetota bacterium]
MKVTKSESGDGIARGALPVLGQVPLHRSLMVRVPGIVAMSVLVIMALVFLLMEIVVKPRLRDLADKSVAQSSALIGQELRKRVTIAGTLCQELARVGELLSQDAQEHMRVLPRLIGGVGDDWFVAGGGVWPEPGQFTPGVERRCFFFGREPDGKLKYYDDYNDPAGPGYHHEEWYVPVRFVEAGTVYWSRSYVDPYSHEPMVTCSSPMYRDGKYYGVVTIDVKLSGLGELFRQSTSEIGGYAFAVDREGVFLTFPDDSLIRTVRKDEKGTSTDSFLSTDELATKHPAFAPIAFALQSMDVDAINVAKSAGQYSDEVAVQIDKDSYQIDARQAQLIAGFLKSTKESAQVRRIDVNDELRLGERCIVDARRMPDTGWKIVTVMPESRVLAASQRLYGLLMMWLGGVMVVGLGGTLLVLYRDIVRPLTRMTRSIGMASGGRMGPLEITGASDGELGLLAATINAYSRSLADAMTALAMHKDELEARVADRTRELSESNGALELSRKDADAASKAKSEFLANMSHEIRTPLTAILGYTDILREDGAQEGSGRLACIDTINKAGTHLLAVINDILDLSKIEADRMTVEQVETPIVRILAEVESLMRPRAASKGVELRVGLTGAVPSAMMADPTRVRQILMNIAGNAIKFTEHGRVTINARVQSPSGTP